ncbi:MAG: TonB-dependent receptor, partial [Alphaproteobacteria bacterium]
YHDNKDLDFTLSGGFAFDGGRGHVVMSGEVFSNSGANGTIDMTGGVARRPYARQGYALIPGGPGQPLQVAVPNVKFANMTFGGLITSGPLKGIYFGPNGALETMTYGTHLTVPTGTYMQGGTGDATQLMGSISPQLGRESLYTHVSYDFTPDFTAWAQLLIVHETAFSPNVPNYDNNTLTIKSDNPFIPAAAKTLMTANNLTQFTFGRVDPELGLGQSKEYTYDVLWDVGFNGKIFGNWAWDLTAQYNSNQWNFKYLHERNNALWALGIDVTSNPTVAAGGVAGVAVGAPICRSTLANPSNGCVPINLFGINSITPAMVAYAGGYSLNTAPQQAWDVSANLNGILLQDWAGDVSVAAGFEARRDSVHMYADAVSIAKSWRAYNLPPFTGNFQVEEGYLEADVPLLKDVPFAQNLGLNAAGRLTNYSNFGTVETWKIGLDNQVNDDLRMRATYSSDIRAPTLNDLFAAGGVNQGQFFDNFAKQSVTLRTTTGGNPKLLPEQGNTFTGGLVYSPGWLAGFTGSLDYFSIHLHNGIQTTTAQQALDACQLYNIASACSLITRDASGKVTDV